MYKFFAKIGIRKKKGWYVNKSFKSSGRHVLGYKELGTFTKYTKVL